MIRIVKLSGKFYGYDMKDIDPEEVVEQIEGFTDQGDPVLLVNELRDLEEWDIDPSEVKMVE